MAKQRKKEVSSHDKQLQFKITEEQWKLIVPKSETKISHVDELKLLTINSDDTVPLNIVDLNDEIAFSYIVTSDKRTWSDLRKLSRNEKLRSMANLLKLTKHLSTRVTFFIHPNNIVFDENLMPQMIYRGMKQLVYPFQMEEETLLKQYKCYILALFNDKFTFDELYNGAMDKADDTEFQRSVHKVDNFQKLKLLIEENFKREEEKVKQTMIFVKKQRYSLFKYLSISLIVLSFLLLMPLLYLYLIKSPNQEDLLTAHREFLGNNYSKVIETLQNKDIQKLPHTARYILASSFVNVESLSEEQKESIMQNINLKSDSNYLTYWIKNGNGEFDESIDIAKVIEDPQLIIYGLIRKIEQIKNDPKLSGAEREGEIGKLQEELDKYNEQYELDIEEEVKLQSDDETNNTSMENEAEVTEKQSQDNTISEIDKKALTNK